MIMRSAQARGLQYALSPSGEDVNIREKSRLAAMQAQLERLEDTQIASATGSGKMSQTIDTRAIHVIDDDDSFRKSMMRLLSGAGFNVFGYRCAGEFLIAQSGDTPGCMLLDITMPGPSGIELLKALVRRAFVLPVIFITARDDIYTTVDVMKSGAFDYLVKPVSADRVLPVVHRAMQVDAKRRDERRELEDLKRRFDSLTPSERAIFHGILCNKLNKQVAAELGACERTIKAQRAGMMSKLGLSSLPELVRAARQLEAAGLTVRASEKGRRLAAGASASIT